MYSKVFTTTVAGIDGVLIEVETNISNGIPSFKIVGMSDRIVKESCERVISAMRNSGLEFPARKIRVNLAPSEIPKTGTGIDLAIALGIYCACNQIIDNIYAFGELGLNGEIKTPTGTLQFIEQSLKYIEKTKKHDAKIVIPKDTTLPIAINANSLYLVSNLREAIYALKSKIEITKKLIAMAPPQDTANNHNTIDDIIGLENVKRMLLIASAGGHHVLLGGSLGVGKTHIAKAMINLLPLPNENEIFEIAKVQSATGVKMSLQRPFREINKGITMRGLIGGGNSITPGEITLAHKGVLFIDELAEHSTSILNTLREPMENKYIVLSNQQSKTRLPCDFTLVAATNLCPCGKENCTCTQWEKQRYIKHIPPAILNRIDLYSYVERANLFAVNKEKLHDKYKEIVANTRRLQNQRFESEDFAVNAQIPVAKFDKYCPLNNQAINTLEKAITKLSLNGRDYAKIIRIARTIADIAEKDMISENEILEALSYRTTSLRTEVSF